MFSPFTEVLGLVALVGICQAGNEGTNLDSSNISPVSIVYTVDPYYNSGALIWKTEEQVIADTFARQSAETETRNIAYSGVRDVTSGSNYRESSRNNSEESANTGSSGDGIPEITYWPPIQRGAVPKLIRRSTTRPEILRPSNVNNDV